MILSMKPPYDITIDILKLVARVSEKLGEVKALFLDKPSLTLRKRNKIKTIHSSLKIEGNTYMTRLAPLIPFPSSRLSLRTGF